MNVTEKILAEPDVHFGFFLTVLPRIDPADAWRRGPGGVAHAELVDQALAGVGQEDGAAVLLDKNKWEKYPVTAILK